MSAGRMITPRRARDPVNQGVRPGLGADVGRLPSRGYRLDGRQGRGRLWGRAAICGLTGGAGSVNPGKRDAAARSHKSQA
jgi:hypothetical protein